MNEFKEYKNLSPYRYNEGYSMWIEFIHLLNKLESEDLYNYNQYFDNAYFYLKKSCNIYFLHSSLLLIDSIF